MDPVSRNTGIADTVCQLIAVRARNQPLLILIEDIHWADQATLNHLARIASTVAECAALLVMTTRVEGKTKDQEWLASLRACPVTVMELTALQPDDALTLARQLTEGDAAHLEALVRRAEGNPLFLVQLAISASHDVAAQLPDTLMGLVLARDGSSPRERSPGAAGCFRDRTVVFPGCLA